MKKILKCLFMLAMIFILPSFVLADEVSTTFDHIDINETVSLKYKVLNTEYSIPNVDASLSGIKLYKLDKDGNNRTEISFSTDNITEVENGYRINGEFEKYYTADDTSVSNEVKYVVEYTYVANSVASNNKNVIYITDPYSFSSENNASTDEGILVKLQDTEVVKTFAPKLLLTKNLDLKVPDGTFTFSINDQTVSITTEGASETVGGSKTETIYLDLNTTYVVREINIPNTYEFVSINSTRDTDGADDTITFTTTGSLDDEISVAARNKNKVEHAKEITDNGDGTHKISLDVVGENEKQPANKANVVVIFDVSNSMTATTGNTIYRYNSTTSDSSSNTYYGLVNGDYVLLERRGSNRYYYNNVRYRGQRYTRTSVDETRLIAEQEAVKSLAGSLLANNILNDDDPDNNDIVMMAFLTFATTVESVVDPTNSYTTIESAINSTVASSGAAGGTNWEAALERAKTISFGSNREATTYYIFVSDGNPTFRVTSHSDWRLYNNGSHREWATNPDEYYYSSSWQENRSRYAGEGHRGTGSTDYYEWNYSDAAEVAKEIVDSGIILYSVGTYGDAARMEHLANYAYTGNDNTSPEGTYYYDAADTDELNAALKEILAEIERSGIGTVTIVDGTTQSVTATTGVVSNLLTVDDTSFEYWLTFPVTDGNKIYVNDTEVTITNNNGTYRLSWTEGGTAKYVDAASGSHFDTENNTFVYKWTSANQLYNVAPPTATLTNASVNWVLSKENVGLLLNDVKYTVTFDVWPSQETYDLISDLDNGIQTYDSLDPNIKKYLVQNADGSYSLRTNTTTRLTYDDSRDDDGERTTSFVNPDPVETGVSKVTILKKWENDLDGRTAKSIELYLTRDGSRYGDTDDDSGEILPYVLEKASDWKQDIFIATGLISLDETNKTAIIREIGHDYGFEEKKDDTYYWDLVVQIRRPMIINDELKMLIKVTDSNEVTASEIGSKNYLEKNGNKYYRICDKSGDNCAAYREATGDDSTSILATNWRRSNLNITKVVENNDYPEGTTFKFELTVVDALSKPTDVRDVWFSIMDEDENLIKTATVTGATKEASELKEVEGGPISDIHVYEDEGIVTYLYNGVLNTKDFAGYKTVDGVRIPTYYTYYYYTPSGTKITVDLKPTWNLRFINLPNGSTYTFTEIQTAGYKFISAVSEQDTITSTDFNDNTKKYTVNGTIKAYNTSYLVTYTNKHVVTDVEVIKVWNNDNENVRPTSITVYLYNGGNEPYKTATLDSSNNWKYKWTDLDKYDSNDELIIYTVDEDTTNATLNDYYSQVEGYTIINTYKYTTIRVTKDWDNTPSDKKADVLVKIQSTLDSYDYHDQTTLDNSNNWTDTFTVLKYILDNNELVEVTYGVEEVSIEGTTLENGVFIDYNDTIHAIVGKWTSVVSGNMYDGFTIKNTYKAMPTRIITLKKKSFDGDSLEGAVFVLYRYIGTEEVSGTQNINLSNPGSNWLLMQEVTSDSNGEFVFNGLYDSEGNLILSGLYEGEYRLIEIEAPAGYILPKGQWILFLELSQDESEVVINKDKSSSTDPTKTPALLIHPDSGSIDIEVYNENIPTIPSTGGIGIPHNNKYGLLIMLLSVGIWLFNIINQRRQIEKFN